MVQEGRQRELTPRELMPRGDKVSSYSNSLTLLFS